MTQLSRRALVEALLAGVAGVRLSAQARVRGKPKPLAKDAVAGDWTSFLGPAHNGTSAETRLTRTLPPPLVWEFPKGTSYTSPAILGDRLVYVHRVGDEEVVECLHAETGESRWQFRYPTSFEDRYGYNNGPRSSPVIDGNRVYTLGAQGQLHCFDIGTGALVWRRHINAEYKVPQDFFGTATTPLVEDKLLVINVGAPGGPCVVGLDKVSGREVWRAGKEWGPSYASPVPAIVHGRRRVFVFAGGESDPPSGGLLSIDPANGAVDFTFPWRSRSYESVNASCPVVFDNKVFISASYRTGGVLLEIRPDFTHRQVWTTQEFGLHWNTPIYRNGYLYGFDGRNEPDASLACVDVASGKAVWRATPEWNETVAVGSQRREQLVSTYRGSLLAVDGQFLCLGELGHLVWMDLSPKGYKEVSRAWLFGARESWALPVLSRGLLYVVQNTRDVVNGAGPRLLCYDLRA
ncbi:MAG TPA: PQQ-binding-like beta-propeller repeat protein [Vicinamibacterales bacterium]|nr:PQQ-binding-like beta-propeller repeat protein [Vicinamibacterales bacterium]